MCVCNSVFTRFVVDSRAVCRHFARRFYRRRRYTVVAGKAIKVKSPHADRLWSGLFSHTKSGRWAKTQCKHAFGPSARAKYRHNNIAEIRSVDLTLIAEARLKRMCVCICVCSHSYDSNVPSCVCVCEWQSVRV